MRVDARRLLLVGCYPPPYGGTSVHVARLREALADAYRVDVVDAYGRPRPDDDAGLRRCGGAAGAFALVAALRGTRAALAHVHVSGLRRFAWTGSPLAAALPRETGTVLTVHGGAFAPRASAAPRWKRRLLRAVLARFDRIVVVGDAQRSAVVDLGIDPRRIALVPAFLPPVATESARARATLARLAGLAGDAGFVVTSGCLRSYYGFHVVLDALARLEPSRRPALLACAYDVGDAAYEATLRARTDVGCAIVRDLTPGEFAWILTHAVCYVRASDRDGDAVAIREARYLGTPTIASDCVARPGGTTTFATGDAAALAAALAALPSADASQTSDLTRRARDEGASNIAALRAIYDEVVAERARATTRAFSFRSPA